MKRRLLTEISYVVVLVVGLAAVPREAAVPALWAVGVAPAIQVSDIIQGSERSYNA